MAKPIFILKLNKLFINDDISIFMSELSKELSDYHVLVTKTNNDENSYECFNDCNGLQDIDIEKIIKVYSNAIQ